MKKKNLNDYFSPSEFRGEKLNKEDIIRYYDYLRKEIEREDKITYERTVTTLSLQGFLITAIALMTGGSGSNPSPSLDRIIIMVLISISGIALSFFSLKGITAARKSLYWAKREWVIFNRKNGYIYPNLLPQVTRRSNENQDDTIKRLGNDNGFFLKKIKSIFRIKDESYINGSNRYYEIIKRYYIILKIDAGSIYFQSIPFVMMIFWFFVFIVVIIRVILTINI